MIFEHINFYLDHGHIMRGLTVPFLNVKAQSDVYSNKTYDKILFFFWNRHLVHTYII